MFQKAISLKRPNFKRTGVTQNMCNLYGTPVFIQKCLATRTTENTQSQDTNKIPQNMVLPVGAAWTRSRCNDFKGMRSLGSNLPGFTV